MKRITFYSFKGIIYLLLFIGHYANAQSSSLIWSKTLGQGIGADHLNDITTDSLGNIYAIGSFNPSMDFDPGPGTTFITSAGYHDMYIAKYDNTGNLIWVKTMGGASSDYWFAIELDHLGNIYTIGTFRYSVDFDPGPNSTTYSHDYHGDIAIAKYTNSGDFIWAKHLKCSGSVDNWAYDLALDDSLNVYVTGSFRTTVDFDPSSGNTANLTSSGLNDAFLAKYDSSGNYKWAFNIGSSNNDYGYAITIDDSNNVYLGGYLSGTVDLDPGSNTANFSSNGGTDAIVAKYDRNGNYQWGKNIGGAGNDQSKGVIIGSDNYLYLCGQFTGTTNFDPGSVGFNLSSVGNTDIFVAKYALNGNFIWAKGIGGSGEDKSEGIVADLYGNFYHYGRFSSTIDFNPGTSSHVLSTANSSADNYVAKFNNNGDFVNAFSLPSTTSNQYIAGLTILNNQNILLGGSFNGSINLSPNSQTTNINTTGHHDIFMSTYTPLSSFNLTATPISQTQIDLQWSDVSSSEVGYTIERSDSANGTFVQIGLTNTNDTTFSDLTGLSAGNTYYYRVAWIDSSGTTSTYSLVVDTATYPNVPIAPTSLITTALSASKIQLNWTDNSNNETGFIVQRAAVNGSFSGIDLVNANITTYVDSNLSASTSYLYRVLAFNAGGISTPSNLSSTITYNITISYDTITTFAGTGSYQFSGDGGPAANAGFKHPAEIIFDQVGNSFIADKHNHRIRKIDATTGIITTIAGTGVDGYSGDGGPAITAKLNLPYGLCFSPNGNLIIADAMNHRIRKIDTTTGIITTIAGTGVNSYSGDGGPATAANINWPLGITYDNQSNLLIAERHNHRIRKVDTAGIITTIAGGGNSLGDGGLATQAMISDPHNVKVDHIGNIYIADYGANRVRKIDTNGIITTFAGTGVSGYSGDGGPANLAQIKTPFGIAFAPDGNILISEYYGHRIRMINPSTNVITTIAGTGNEGYSGDGGSPLLAKLRYPSKLTFGNDSNLYIADHVNQVFRKIITNASISPALSDSFNLTATPISQTQIDLQWSDVSSIEVGYTIERSDSANGTFVQVGFTNTNDTTFSDLTGLSAGNTYYYRVAWIDSSGTTSAYSLVADTATHPNVPIAPTSLMTTPLSASKIQLNWTDNSSNETGFIVQRAAVNGSFSGIDSVNANVTTYVDSNLTAATTYVYRILAYNSGGASNPSNTSSATTFNLAPTPPDNLTATGMSDMQINLNWSDNSTDETFFVLQRSISVSGPYTVVDTLPQNTTNYSDYSGLSLGTTYYYLLSAGNISGTSVSDSVSAQTNSSLMIQNNVSNLKCEDAQFCHQWELLDTVNNAIGFDFTINYDTSHYQFTGLNLDELDSTLWDYSWYTNPDFSVNISVYVKSSAPTGTSFSGNGQLACLEFHKKLHYLSGTDTINFSPLTISYDNGIEKRGIANAAIHVVKDSLASGKLLSWNNLQPMLYNVSNSSAFNKTEIFGANTTCDTVSTIASSPNMSGVFYHNINNGEQLKIKRDIDSTTVVMPFINGYDAFLTKRIVLGDTSYQPTVKTIIAADVNRDGVVTAGDITLLNQRTTMKIDQFPYTTPGTTDDWLFTDSASTQGAAYQISANFPDDDGTGYSRHRVPAFESCLPIDVTYLGACPNFEQMTYYGLLLGDVDGNFQQFGANGNFKTEETTVVYDLDGAIKPGNSQIKIPVYIAGDNATQSVDFQMDYDKNTLEFISVVPGLSSLDYLSNEFNQSLLFTSYSAQSIDENDIVGYLLFNTKTQEITHADLGTIESYVNGNKVSSKVTGSISTSVNGLNTSPQKNIRVFPNPNNGLFSVQLIPSKTILLKIFSMDGKLIWSKDIKDLQESYLQEVSLVDYAIGIYTLSIETEEQRVIKRIVIQ